MTWVQLLLSLYSGKKDIVYKRLKNHLCLECIGKDPSAPWELKNQCDANPYNLDYICVLDFEATCEDPNPPDYIHEIIEFPVVLLNLKTLQVVRDLLPQILLSKLLLHAT